MLSVAAAGTEVARKREIENVKDQFDKDLKKQQKKMEALEKQIGE